MSQVTKAFEELEITPADLDDLIIALLKAHEYLQDSKCWRMDYDTFEEFSALCLRIDPYTTNSNIEDLKEELIRYPESTEQAK